MFLSHSFFWRARQLLLLLALSALTACNGGGGDGGSTTPVAVNDSYTTAAGQATLTVGSPGVLANDSGSGLTAELVTPPANNAGTFTLNANGSFTYVLNSASTATTDSFTYRAKIGTTSSTTATVTINITPPTATADSYTVSAPGALLTVGSPGVLSNDSGTGMTVDLPSVTPPAHATSFTLNANGSFNYTHDGTSTPTTDSFRYRVKVGSLVSNTVTVTLTINRPPVASGGCKNTAWNTPVSIDLKPLVSDADNSIAPANFAITVQGTKGTASPPDANGMVTYVPSGSTVTGADSFTYQYTDPAGAPATGQVKVAIGNRIMPVGDSVTAGIWTGLAPSASDRTGYRRKLYADLTSGGKNTISFVGQYLEGCTAGILDIHCGNTSDPAIEGAHHDGTRGLQDDTLNSSSTAPDGDNSNGSNDDGDITDRLNLNPADIVLIHIGTNGIDGSDTTVDAASIVTKIRNWESGHRPVTVLFARIISSPNSTYAANASTRNNTAEANLRARSDFGGEIGVDTLDRSKRLFLVDMQAAAPNGAGLSYVIDTTDPYTSGDMYDDFHPNSNGYDKMADAWRNALTSIGLACP